MFPQAEPSMSCAGGNDAIVDPLLIGMAQMTENGNLVLGTVTSIRRSQRHILVDTGGFNQWEALRSRLRTLPPVTDIILTHFHWDHCANLRHFPGVPIYASAQPSHTDRATLTDVLDYSLVRVHEGDRVADLVDIWEVPGHTMNHLAVSLVSRGQRYTVAGDAIATSCDAAGGVPKLVFYSRSVAKRSLVRILHNSDWVIPGHGKPFPVKSVALS